MATTIQWDTPRSKPQPTTLGKLEDGAYFVHADHYKDESKASSPSVYKKLTRSKAHVKCYVEGDNEAVPTIQLDQGKCHFDSKYCPVYEVFVSITVKRPF